MKSSKQRTRWVPKETTMTLKAIRHSPAFDSFLCLAGCDGLSTTASTQPTTLSVTTTAAVTSEEDTTESTETTTLATTGSAVTLQFETNGGTAVAPITRASGASVEAPADPLKSGYEFAGWYEDAELTDYFEFGIMPDESMTLYAEWGTAGLSYQLMYDDESYRVAAGTAATATAVVIPGRHLGLPGRGARRPGLLRFDRFGRNHVAAGNHRNRLSRLLPMHEPDFRHPARRARNGRLRRLLRLPRTDRRRDSRQPDVDRRYDVRLLFQPIARHDLRKAWSKSARRPSGTA
ncbi:MAG: InlB B-repeat-containing protein [Bacillus subtilis]|nr:InlB B-repeat-containing protein [Bacillus subtilis]